MSSQGGGWKKFALGKIFRMGLRSRVLHAKKNRRIIFIAFGRMQHYDMLIHSPTIPLPLQLTSPLYHSTMHNIKKYTKINPNHSS